MKARADIVRAAPVRLKGRGAADNSQRGFERQGREAFDDGWHIMGAELPICGYAALLHSSRSGKP